jgi:hypothetical protein
VHQLKPGVRVRAAVLFRQGHEPFDSFTDEMILTDVAGVAEWAEHFRAVLGDASDEKVQQAYREKLDLRFRDLAPLVRPETRLMDQVRVIEGHLNQELGCELDDGAVGPAFIGILARSAAVLPVDGVTAIEFTLVANHLPYETRLFVVCSSNVLPAPKVLARGGFFRLNAVGIADLAHEAPCQAFIERMRPAAINPGVLLATSVEHAAPLPYRLWPYDEATHPEWVLWENQGHPVMGLPVRHWGGEIGYVQPLFLAPDGQPLSYDQAIEVQAFVKASVEEITLEVAADGDHRTRALRWLN